MILDAQELKRRYLQRIASVRDRKVDIGPEVVDLVINNSCNLSCKFCWDHAPGNPNHFDKSYFFPWNKFVDVVRDCVDMKVDQITMVGSGEPSLHPLFREMLRHLESQPLGVKLFTNATFPLEYCSDVIKADYVTINLSAVDRQHYNEVQGKDLFDRVVANIERLVSLRNSTKPKFYIELAYIVNALNVNQRKKMKDFALQLGVNSVFYKRMNVHTYNRTIALPKETPGGEERRTPPKCLNGWFNMVVYAENKSSVCCRISKMNLGDIEKESLKQVWFSPRMMNVRLLGKYGRIQTMYTACQTCSYYDQNIRRSQTLDSLEHELA